MRSVNGGGHPLEPLDLAEAASLTGSRLSGEPGWIVEQVVPIGQAGPGKLGFLADRRYVKHVPEGEVEAVLVSSELADAVAGSVPNLLVADDARLALARLIDRLHPEAAPRPGVHPTAVLGRGVVLGAEVQIGPYVVLEEGVKVGDRAALGAHAVVGARSVVGAGSKLHPHVVVYPDSNIGERCVLHAGAVIGSDGFGYVPEGGRHAKIRQVGGCRIGDDVEIGAHCCIDRGSIGDTVVGAGTKLDNLVHVAHNVTVGDHSLLIAQVGISGSTRLGQGVVMAGQSGATGHLEIGDGVQVAVQTGVLRDVAAGEQVVGFPARPRREFWKSMASTRKLPDLEARVAELEARLEALGAGPAETREP